MRDSADRFDEYGATIVGASFDAIEENLAFATDQEFPFPLLSDTDRSVGAAFGVARPDGDKFAPFARRLSFLIDPDGIIRRVYDVADVATHPDEVLDDLRLLAP